MVFFCTRVVRGPPVGMFAKSSKRACCSGMGDGGFFAKGCSTQGQTLDNPVFFSGYSPFVDCILM